MKKWLRPYAGLSASLLTRKEEGADSLGGFVEQVETGEMALGVERGHATHACGGHRLAIDVVGNVARRVHAGDVGRGRVGRGLDVAGGLHLDLVLEQLSLRLWPMAMKTPSAGIRSCRR